MRDVRLSDAEIDGLVAETKPAIDPDDLLPTTVRLAHRRGALEVEARSGSNFKVLVCQQEANPLGLGRT